MKSTNHRYRFTAVVLALLLMLSLLPTSAFALEGEEEYTALYLDKGSITIGDNYVSGFDAYGNAVSEPNSLGYIITQTNENSVTVNTISVISGSHRLVLRGINMRPENDWENAIELSETASVELILDGSNKIEINSTQASAIRVPAGGTLKISGDIRSELYINHHKRDDNDNALSAAAIGSGSSTDSGAITIEGGMLTIASVTSLGAGIGGGRQHTGSVSIKGGVLNITASYGAAIGSGNGSSAIGSVSISGGTIHASRRDDPTNGDIIGNGRGATNTAVTITGGTIHADSISSASNGNSELFPVTVRLDEQPNMTVDRIIANSKAYGSTDVKTDESGILYFWLPAGGARVSVRIVDTTYYFQGTVSTTSVTELPASQGNEEEDADALKNTAERAMLSIPEYIGTNDTEVRTAVEKADHALEEAMTYWSLEEIQDWDGYQHYLESKARISVTFPSVTLTVLGFEDDTEYALYYFAPTICSVTIGSTVAEVLVAALEQEHLVYSSTGSPEKKGGFFLKSVQGQANSGSVGWMYMVNNNSYISYGMSDYTIKDGDNILVYYSTKGYTADGGDSDPEDDQRTPYGEYDSFTALSEEANTKPTMDLKVSGANAVLAKDWAVIEHDLGFIRTAFSNIELPVVGVNGSAIVWKSTNEEAITSNGTVTLSDESVEVELDATLYYAGEKLKRSLTMMVGATEGISVNVIIDCADPENGPGALLTFIEDSGGYEGETELTINGLTGTTYYDAESGEPTEFAIEDPNTGEELYLSAGSTPMAVHALYAALAGYESAQFLEIEEAATEHAHIWNLFNAPGAEEFDFALPYNPETGSHWMVRITDEDDNLLWEGDYTNNLLLPLAENDTVTYRYVAGIKPLEELYEAAAKIGSTYTEETLTPLLEAREAAAAVLEKNLFELTQSEVDEAYEALEESYENLVFKLDYFKEGADGLSIHDKVLSFITEHTAWVDQFGSTNLSTNGYIALALNGMLNEDFVKLGMNDLDSALWKTLSPTTGVLTSQANSNNGLTLAGYDMTYFYSPSFQNGFERHEYALDYANALSVLMPEPVNSYSNRLRIMNVLPYPDYMNRQKREDINFGVTNAYSLYQLIDSQEEDGGWPDYANDGGGSHYAGVFNALMALAPYYFEDVDLPDGLDTLDPSINVEKIRQVANDGIDYMLNNLSNSNLFQTDMDFVSAYGDRVINVLLLYGRNPQTIKTMPCTHGDGLITYVLKTFLSEDQTHFRKKDVEERWISEDRGSETSRYLKRIGYLNNNLALTMSLYKQCLDENGEFKDGSRASLCLKEDYQNQNEKIALELSYYTARHEILGLKDYEIETIYENIANYTEESVAPLLIALDNAKYLLEHLDSEKEDIIAAKEALDEAMDGLVKVEDPAEIVMAMINNLTDVDPEHLQRDAITAARNAFDALSDEEKERVENINALINAEYWYEIAYDYSLVNITDNYILTIGNGYASSSTTVSDDWKVVDMVIAGRDGELFTTAGALEDYVTQSIAAIDLNNLTDCERVLIAVTSLGVDGSNLSQYHTFVDSQGNEVKNLVDAICNFGEGDAGELQNNALVFGLLALDSGNYTEPDNAPITREDLIRTLVERSGPGWGLDENDEATVDITAMAITALAPYAEDNEEIAEVVANALSWLATMQEEDGTGAFIYGGKENANSTAMVIIARIAAGENPREAYDNGTEPVYSLIKCFGLEECTGFGFINKSFDDMATEQSFRALAAYRALAYQHTTTPYRFGEPTLKGPWDGTAASITLDPTEITLAVNGTEQLEATVTPEGATVTWSSSDPEVATVSNDGLVTAKKAGTATITAALADGKEATCAVTVKEETSISLNKTETTLTVGETEQLKAMVSPETEAVTWSSSDTDVATVSAAGLVTAVKAGTVTITAALADGKEATCSVTVQKDPTKITISFTLLGDTVHGNDGHVHTLKSGNESLTTWIDTAYIIVPVDSTVWDLLEQVLADNGYTWNNPTNNYVKSITTPSGLTLAEKDNNHQKSGWMYTLNGVHPNLGVNQQTLADGDTVVFHYTDDMTEETDVGGELVVDSLRLNKEKLELDSGASEKLIATVDPLGAPVTWSSSDTAIATVSENGVVTAVAPGYATITASSGDKTAQCKVIVDGYNKVEALKAEIAALPDNVTAANKDAVNTAKAHYDALTAAQKKLLTTEETAKLMKAVNTLQVLNDLDGLAETKDFTSTDANTKNAVAAALGDWLNNSKAKVSVTAFTAAVDGTAEKPEGKAGSYSATITLSVGTGDAAASGSKTVTGSITPKAYAPGSETGVKSIKVSGIAAKGSGTSYSAVLPYGADLSALTAKSFTITLKDTNAKVSAAPATADGGKTWTFTVTAEDGATAKEYTVTLSVSDVKVTLLDSAIYSVADDVEVTSLSPAAVEGLLEAVSIDDLKLPEGTKAIGLWLKVTAVKKDGKDITVKLEPVYSYDGSEETAVPADAIISEFTVTLPIEGTEYVRVLYGGNYLTAKVSEDGISFAVEVPGEYTLIPDARLVTVTFHLCGGSSDDVTDGEKIVYYRENAGDELPRAVKDDNRFEGWFDTEDGTGKVFATVTADLPAELYAMWSSDVKIQEVGDIDDEVTVSATVENDVATITVTADEPCIVIVKKGDTYERMEAVDNKDGSYSFVQDNYDVNMVFYVAILGDFDRDGDLDKADLTAANKAIMSNKTIEPLQVMIMGAEGKKLKTVDLAKLCFALANKEVDW